MHLSSDYLSFCISLNVSYCLSMYVLTLEKIRYRIIVPEFYVILCKHGRSVAIG